MNLMKETLADVRTSHVKYPKRNLCKLLVAGANGIEIAKCCPFVYIYIYLINNDWFMGVWNGNSKLIFYFNDSGGHVS